MEIVASGSHRPPRRAVVNRPFNSDGDGSSANRTIRMRIKPHIDTIHVKGVFTGGELPDLLAVVERRQAHRTLVADFRTVLVLVVLNGCSHITRRTISDHHGDGGAGEPGGSLPPEAEEIGWALDGEEEGVD